MGRMGWVPQHARRLVLWRRRGVYATLATIAAVGLGVPLLVNALDDPNSDSLLIVTDPTPWVGGQTGAPSSNPNSTSTGSPSASSDPSATPSPTPTASATEPGDAADGSPSADAGDDRSTSTSSTSPSTPDSSASTILACAADFDIVQSWSSGFTADLAVTNSGNRDVDRWKVTFSLQGNYEVTSSWGGQLSQEGRAVTISGGSDDSINPGSSRTLGFVVSGKGNPKPPSDIALNGTACS